MEQLEVKKVKPYPPKWQYHPKQGGVIVRSEEQSQKLGKGWYDSPADFPKVEVVAPTVVAASKQLKDMELEILRLKKELALALKPKAKSRRKKAS